MYLTIIVTSDIIYKQQYAHALMEFMGLYRHFRIQSHLSHVNCVKYSICISLHEEFWILNLD